jgi:hypothetical protein
MQLRKLSKSWRASWPPVLHWAALSPSRFGQLGLVGMMARFRDHMRNIVDRDDAIEQHHITKSSSKSAKQFRNGSWLANVLYQLAS